jgi:hypothetical protein
MPLFVSLALMPLRENLISLGRGRSAALVLGSGECQHGADELVDGGGQPGHAMLPRLLSCLHRVPTALLHRHHLMVSALLRNLLALERLRQDCHASWLLLVARLAVVVPLARRRYLAAFVHVCRRCIDISNGKSRFSTDLSQILTDF